MTAKISRIQAHRKGQADPGLPDRLVDRARGERWEWTLSRPGAIRLRRRANRSGPISAIHGPASARVQRGSVPVSCGDRRCPRGHANHAGSTVDTRPGDGGAVGGSRGREGHGGARTREDRRARRRGTVDGEAATAEDVG